jgi:hypothetical protein
MHFSPAVIALVLPILFCSSFFALRAKKELQKEDKAPLCRRQIQTLQKFYNSQYKVKTFPKGAVWTS